MSWRSRAKDLWRSRAKNLWRSRAKDLWRSRASKPIFAAIALVVTLACGSAALALGDARTVETASAIELTSATTTTSLPAPITVPQPIEITTTTSTTTVPLDVIGEATANIEAPAVKAPDLATSKWATTTDASCKCTAAFPWKPAVDDVRTSDGAVVRSLTATNASSPFSLAVLSQPIGDAPSDDQLREVVLAIVRQTNGTPTSASFVESNGRRVFDVTAKDGAGTVRLNAFAQNSMLYVLYTGTLGNEDTAPVFKRFASGFRAI